MIDVTSIINDPDFNRPFRLIRTNGSFVNGEWVPVEAAPLGLNGIVLPAKLDELKVLPEGERQLGSIAVYSLVELIMGDQETTTSDLIEYPSGSAQWYRVAFLRYYDQCILWYAVATRYRRAA